MKEEEEGVVDDDQLEEEWNETHKKTPDEYTSSITSPHLEIIAMLAQVMKASVESRVLPGIQKHHK